MYTSSCHLPAPSSMSVNRPVETDTGFLAWMLFVMSELRAFNSSSSSHASARWPGPLVVLANLAFNTRPTLYSSNTLAMQAETYLPLSFGWLSTIGLWFQL